MSGNIFGTVFRVATFGESHGEAVGVVIDGCPAGIPISTNCIQKELDKRKPGASCIHADGNTVFNPAITARQEADKARILSGVFKGVSTGAPVTIEIANTSAHSDDYENLADTFRPGHADYTWQQKYGVRDYRGGGRSSGRETAARVAAGAVARMLLETAGSLEITAYTKQAGGIDCPPFDGLPDKRVIEQNPLKTMDSAAAKKMENLIEKLRKQGDSCGGIIECVISGVPVGWGEPVFDKLDAELAKAVLSIGAVKGIEFGAGFAGSALTGSQWNDSMRTAAQKRQKNKGQSTAQADVYFETNNAGGILGGISNGNTIVFRAAIKPVPSVLLLQRTVKVARMTDTTAEFENADLLIEGRHDVCVCPRIIPVIEAMSALCLADMYLRNKNACRK